MTTKTKEVRIGAVKLVQGGLKGIVVNYEQTEIRNNREFFTEFPGVKKKFPIHQELEDCFGWLKGYLLDICNYSDSPSERPMLLESTTIIGVKYNDKGFVITGKLSTIGDKEFALNTPLISAEDGYPDFDKVTAIMDGIYSETKEYMEGKKIISDEQIVIKFNKGKEDFDINTFRGLSNEEQMKIATEIMTKNKCLIFHNDEIEEDDGLEETIIDTTIEQVPTVEDWVQPKLEVVKETPSEQFSDDTFVIPQEPIKVSTAKKIKA